MTEIVLNLATLSGLALGLTQVVRQAFNLPDRFNQLSDVAFGVGISLLYVGFTRDAALLGLFAGLSAAGLWNGASTFGVALRGRKVASVAQGGLPQV